eukprot:TRINITY_DN2928_c0_g1_i5.p1 TRINITY_DN2928_c0_g1~~TRINITY_DN2928_c0_g1_i5.p1  ORF type:complete len:1294 (-),score=313.14 TRINITY_DN2928_c0_g1_i5:53-3934(-)
MGKEKSTASSSEPKASKGSKKEKSKRSHKAVSEGESNSNSSSNNSNNEKPKKKKSATVQSDDSSDNVNGKKSKTSSGKKSKKDSGSESSRHASSNSSSDNNSSNTTSTYLPMRRETMVGAPYIALESDIDDYLLRELAVKSWIESVLEDSDNNNSSNDDSADAEALWDKQGLAAFLHDGVRLCRLMTVLRPGSVPRIFGINRESLNSEMTQTEDSASFIASAGLTTRREHTAAAASGEEAEESGDKDTKASGWGFKNSSNTLFRIKRDKFSGESDSSSQAFTPRTPKGELSSGIISTAVGSSGMISPSSAAASPTRVKGVMEYEMKKNIYFFLKACEEEGVGDTVLFRVQDLYDQMNMLRVLECVEIVGALAEKEWEHTEVTLRRKTDLLKQFKRNLDFTPDQRQRVKQILEHCIPRKRGLVVASPKTVERGPPLKERKSKESKYKTRRSVKFLLGGKKASKNITVKEDEAQHPALQFLYGKNSSERPATYTEIDRVIADRIETEERAIVFLKGITRLQARCRAQQARKVLQAKMRNDAYRENVAREIYKTEKDYVKSLDILVDKILLPIKQLVAGKDKDAMVSFKTLLADLQIIRGYHRDLLASLEPRITTWTPNQCLGDIFVRVSQFLKVYTQYVSRYNHTLQEITSAKKQFPKVAEFFRELAKDKAIGNEDVNSFLVRPIQRIPRYLLLLKDLVKHTGLTHRDFADLEKASAQISEVAHFVEEKAEEAERIGKLFEIQSRLYGEFETLVNPSRRFVKEGMLKAWSTDERRIRPRSVFLFNDIVVIAKQKKAGTLALVFCNMYHLNNLSVSQPSEHEPRLVGFALKDNTAEVDIVRLYAESSLDLEMWKTAFDSVIQDLVAKRKEHHDLIMMRAQQKAQQARMLLSMKYLADTDADTFDSASAAVNMANNAGATGATATGESELTAVSSESNSEYADIGNSLLFATDMARKLNMSLPDQRGSMGLVMDERGKAWQSRLAAHQERMARLRQEQAKSQTVDPAMLGRSSRSQVTSLPQGVGSFLLRQNQMQQQRNSKRTAHQSCILLETEELEVDDMDDVTKVQERNSTGNSGSVYLSPDHRGKVGGSLRLKASPRINSKSTQQPQPLAGSVPTSKSSLSSSHGNDISPPNSPAAAAVAASAESMDYAAKRRSWSVLNMRKKKIASPDASAASLPTTTTTTTNTTTPASASEPNLSSSYEDYAQYDSLSSATGRSRHFTTRHTNTKRVSADQILATEQEDFFPTVSTSSSSSSNSSRRASDLTGLELQTSNSSSPTASPVVTARSKRRSASYK